MFLSSGMWWSARTTCWSSLGRSSSSWSSPSRSSGTCGTSAASCLVRILIFQTVDYLVLGCHSHSIHSIHHHRYHYHHNRHWKPFLIRHREPFGVVWPSQIPRLLQDLQRPHPHHEGDPIESYVIIMLNMTCYYHIIIMFNMRCYHHQNDQGAAPNMLRFLICASLLYIGFAFAGWVTPISFRMLTFEFTGGNVLWRSLVTPISFRIFEFTSWE